MTSQDWPEAQRIAVGDIKLAVYHMGPHAAESDKPALLFMHGFPEIAYSWRMVMARLAALGFPCYAPDMRGYGASDKPGAVAAYGMGQLTGDMRGLVDALGLERVIAVGHDWGAIVLWALPYWVPGRFLGFAGLNLAHFGHMPMDPVDMLRAAYGDDYYVYRFQIPEEAESLLSADVDATMSFFLRRPRAGKSASATAIPFSEPKLDLLGHLAAGPEAWGGEPLLNAEERAPYVNAFTEGGFTPPVNWYRNLSANWQAQKQFLEDGVLPKIQEPTLIITAELDRACPPRLADPMPEFAARHSRVDLMGCGHWLQQERPDDVVTALTQWMSREGLSE